MSAAPERNVSVSELQPGQLVRRDGGVQRDGQRGKVVMLDDGTLGVQLDRGNEKLIVPLRENNEWVPDQRRSFQPMQIARISYGADRELRIARGEYGAKDWMNMAERDRVAWMQAGPPRDDEERRALYLAVSACLKGK